MDLNSICDPQQLQQILTILQEISAKLNTLPSSPEALSHIADKVLNNMVTYRLLFPQ